jgi:hypothetical protein
LAPELDGHPRTLQLSALGVQDVIAKEVAHCRLLSIKPLQPQDTPCMAAHHRSPASFPGAAWLAIIAQK